MLPTGTVTFLMTDLEGSTGLVARLGDDYEAMMSRQRTLIRTAVSAAGGAEIDVHGDEVFSAGLGRDGRAAGAR
jgi:class 3 adenylate cyclase